MIYHRTQMRNNAMDKGDTLEGKGSGLVITVGSVGECGVEEIFSVNYRNDGVVQRGEI